MRKDTLLLPIPIIIKQKTLYRKIMRTLNYISTFFVLFLLLLAGEMTRAKAQTQWIPELLGPLTAGSVQVNGNDISASMVTSGGGASGYSTTILSALGGQLASSNSWMTLSNVTEYASGVYGLSFSFTRNTGTQTRSWYFYFDHTRYYFTQPVGTVPTLTVTSIPEKVFPEEPANVELYLSNTISGDNYVLTGDLGETILTITGNGGNITRNVKLHAGNYSLSGVNTGNNFSINHYSFVENPPSLSIDTLVMASSTSQSQITVSGYIANGQTVAFSSSSEAMEYLEPFCEWCNSGRNPGWRKGYSLSAGFLQGNGLLQINSGYPNYGEHDLILSAYFTIIHKGTSNTTLSQNNYILTSDYSDTSKIKKADYYNGIGDVVQTIGIRTSGTGLKDLITLHTYDAHLRENRAWLPYAIDQQEGLYDNSAVAHQAGFYISSGFSIPESTSAFGEYCYESSSLDRMRSTSLPGMSYHIPSHTTRLSYTFNNINNIPKLDITANGDLQILGYESPSIFRCIKTIDGNGNTIEVYSDMEDRIRCEDHRIDSNTVARTLYAYDKFGRLAWVIQPKGVAVIDASAPSGVTYSHSSDFAKKWCFTYVYDKRGRIIKKRIPGSDWQEFIYNNADLPVMTRDGNMATSNKWETIKYDQFRRIVEEGITSALPVSITRDSLQAAFDAGNTPSYWSSPDKLLHEYMYDTYPVLSGSVLAFEGVEGITMLSGNSLADNRANGLLTWEKTYSVDGPNYKQQTIFYDKKGRIIRKATLHSNGGFNVLSLRYDFRGNIIRYNEASSPAGISSGINNLDKLYTYNGQGRIQSIASTLNGGAPSVVSFCYDDIGRLSSKQHLTTASFQFEEDYTYTLQGWENTHSAMNNGTPYFFSELTYETPFKNGQPDWTGKISSWHWAQTPLGERYYTYNYDALSRLVDTDQYTPLGTSPENVFAEKNITYDLNGNILGMVRYNGSTTPCNISYSYMNGNHRNGYLYDASGNVTMELDENLSIDYNLLNLPLSIASGNSILAYYNYLADGSKYMTLDASGDGFMYDGSFKYNVTGYNAYSLECVSYEDGRFVSSNVPGGVESNIFITDHLGSVRTVINAAGIPVQQNEFLPYGELLYESRPNLTNNDYLYGGKELQDKFGVNLYDSQARFQSNTGAFLSIDPMAEKYYSISPYAYCAGNPINLVDPEGMDIWELHQDGRVCLVEKDEKKHILYATNKNGERINNISFHSDYIPESLSKEINGISKVTLDKSEYKVGVAIFLFMADHSSVEWALHIGEEMTAIGTLHNRDNGGSYIDYGISARPLISLHSHPGDYPTKEDMLFSVGLVKNPRNSKKMDVLAPSDMYNIMNYPDKKADKNFVYFPDLKSVIQLFPNREPSAPSKYLDDFRNLDFQFFPR